ncbi:MAG: hypothetical protein RLZZ308_469 [Candidatus Parcubacteria bacterium]|jgi:predicted transcriptional regulator
MQINSARVSKRHARILFVSFIEAKEMTPVTIRQLIADGFEKKHIILDISSALAELVHSQLMEKKLGSNLFSITEEGKEFVRCLMKEKARLFEQSKTPNTPLVKDRELAVA